MLCSRSTFTSRELLLGILLLAGIGWIYYNCFGVKFELKVTEDFPKLMKKWRDEIVVVAVPNLQTEPEFDSSNLEKYDQKDAGLVNYVRTHHISEPSAQPYTFEGASQGEIVSNIWPILEKVANNSGSGKRFFVEAGAYDGVDGSNTLWLERVHGWTGLLVECHPQVLPTLRKRQRKAYITDACLSGFPHPSKAELQSVDGWLYSSSLAKEIQPDFAKKMYPQLAEAAKISTKTFPVQAIPLYTLLAAMDVSTVDFISLDVQSLEYDILRNFPFDLILVKVWVVEVVLLSPETKIKLEELMLENGYLKSSDPTGLDQLYVHKSWS